MSELRIGLVCNEDLSDFEAPIAARRDCALAGMCSGDETAWRALIGSAEIDAIIVESEMATRGAICETALKRGLHVLCASPPGASLDEVIRIRRAEAASPGKSVRFIMPLRHHGSVTSALNLAASGALGQLLTVRGVYGASTAKGGALIDRGFHLIDLALGFCGPFDDVYGLISDDGARKHERNGMAVLRTSKGVVAQLHASGAQWRHTFRFELGFDKGYIWLDGLATPTADFAPEMLIIGRLQRGPNGAFLPNPDEEIHEIKDAPKPADTLAAFLDSIKGGQGGWLANTRQVFDALNLVQRIYALDHNPDTHD